MLSVKRGEMLRVATVLAVVMNASSRCLECRGSLGRHIIGGAVMIELSS